MPRYVLLVTPFSVLAFNYVYNALFVIIIINLVIMPLYWVKLFCLWHLWRYYDLQFGENDEATVYERRRVKGCFLENLELDDFPFDTQVIIYFLNIFLLLELICCLFNIIYSSLILFSFQFFIVSTVCRMSKVKIENTFVKIIISLNIHY